MITLFSLILMFVGSANWLTIGLLQFDFVAGLFGSQSNIFSRIIYVLVGIGAIIIAINLIKNKGKLKFNFKKMIKIADNSQKQNEPETHTHQNNSQNLAKVSTESGKDHGKELRDISNRLAEKQRKDK